MSRNKKRNRRIIAQPSGVKELIYSSGSLAIYNVSSRMKHYVYDGGEEVWECDSFDEAYKFVLKMIKV